MENLLPLLSNAPGKVSLAFWHLETGERLSVAGDARWPAASLIKLPLAVAAYQAAERGELALEERVEIPFLDDAEAEFDNLGAAPPGHRFTWRKVIDRMLTESDNAATNALIDRLGLEALRPLELEATALNRRMLDTAARAAGRDNFTTADDMVSLLVSLQRGERLDEAHTRELLGLLLQNRDNEKFAAGLPFDWPFAHKTGELPGLRHDAGLVLGPSAWACAMLVEGEAPADALMARVATLLSVHVQSRFQDFEAARDKLASDRARLIPDPRLAWDTLELNWRDGEMALQGLTTVPGRLEALNGVSLQDARVLTGRPGVVAVPCLPLRRGPGHAHELVSQLRMGDPVRLLDQGPDWTLLAGPDGYVAHGKTNNLASDAEWNPTHRLALPLVTVRSDRGKTYQLSAGTRLARDEGGFALSNGDRVRLPDDAALAEGARWTPEAVLAFAERFLGLPYLWGGTTGWGIDCSGLVQLAYAVGGFDLPRDADQQQDATTPVNERSHLQPGDLVFFPGHVGLYRGEGEFVHASAKAGMVTINSFDPASPLYDPWLLENFSGGGMSPARAARPVLSLGG